MKMIHLKTQQVMCDIRREYALKLQVVDREHAFHPFIKRMFSVHLLGLEMDHFHYERLECNGFVNFMKAGIIAADHVTTVSPTYRNEIMNIAKPVPTAHHNTAS